MAVVTRLERKSRRWEQVWNGEAEAIASIVAGRLEAEGIRTRIQGSTTPYRTAAFNLGGSWAILVPAGRAARARDVLRDNDEGHNVVEEEGDGLTSSQRFSLKLAALLVAAVVVVVAAAAVLQAT
jgi:hypothetical protein